MDKRKRDEKLGSWMVASALSRQTKFYHRPMFVNETPTPFKVVKLNAERTLATEVAPLTMWPENECYLVSHTTSFDTFGFVSPCDVVVCDREWKAVQVQTLLPPGSELRLGPYHMNVWILPPNASVSLNIMPGTYVSTRERGTAVER